MRGKIPGGVCQGNRIACGPGDEAYRSSRWRAGRGLADLGEAGLRARKVRKRFPIFVNGWVVVMGTLVELAQIEF